MSAEHLARGASTENGELELRPATVVRRNLPINLNPAELELFGHELERAIPATKLLERVNVNVSAEGILFHRGKMLPESFAFPANRQNWKRRSVVKFFVANYLMRKRRNVRAECVWVIDDWSLGFFHWFGDVLPRLVAVHDRLKDLTLLLPEKCQQIEYVQASLKPFDFADVEYIDINEVVVCDKLFVPTQTAPSGHYNESLIREVRKILVEFYSPHLTSSPDRVYISRGRAPKRRVRNEDEAIEVLREFDFHIVRAEDHSFAEQVQIAAGAQCLVSNHGAGLTNMLFMPPNTKVLELRHAADRINNCYFTLASALDLNYFYQSCQPANHGEDPHTADLIVDIQTLRANIELMLRS